MGAAGWVKRDQVLVYLGGAGKLSLTEMIHYKGQILISIIFERTIKVMKLMHTLTSNVLLQKELLL